MGVGGWTWAVFLWGFIRLDVYCLFLWGFYKWGRCVIWGWLSFGVFGEFRLGIDMRFRFVL